MKLYILSFNIYMRILNIQIMDRGLTEVQIYGGDCLWMFVKYFSKSIMT